MPTVEFEGTKIECSEGDILRDVLREANETPHNGKAGYINCHGLGTCGTCAVEIDGTVSDPTRRERRRLRFPPHTPERGLRLSCQTRVLGDITVTKHDGFWGQSVTDEE